MAELEANKEARERQERHIAELTTGVTSLMGQVKGKRSNPTRNEVPDQQEEEAEDDLPLQCIWQWESPLTLEIVKE